MERERYSRLNQGASGGLDRSSSALFSIFLLGWSFPFLQEERGTVNCPNGPWENRKCSWAQEKARWNLFVGLVLGGRESHCYTVSLCSDILPIDEETLNCQNRVWSSLGPTQGHTHSQTTHNPRRVRRIYILITQNELHSPSVCKHTERVRSSWCIHNT